MKNLKTKYPVLLVHGFGFRDDSRLFKYWANIPEYLRNENADVHLSNQYAFGTIQHNAAQLKKRIYQILEHSQTDKLNLIAHSKGGLDSRYMISKLNMGKHVASLSTISTPHRGSCLANFVLDKATEKGLLKLMRGTITGFSKFMGEKEVIIAETWNQLKPDSMEELNTQMPDVEGVYYQSFASKISENYPNAFQRYKRKIISRLDGENDGVVSVNSSKWTNFRPLVVSNDQFGVSHFDIVGATKKSDFDVYQFYSSILAELSISGF